MADRRRTISTNPGGSSSGLPVPSSIPRPNTTLRQSLAPGAGRASLAPSMGMSAGGGGGRARASIAPGAYASQHGFGESQSSSQGSSQGVFSQGHGGPPAGASRPEPPMTVGRMGAYSSFGASMSVGRPGGPLRSSMAPMGMSAAPMEYAPPSERRTSTYRRSTLGASNALLTATPGGGIGTSTAARPAKDPREARQKANREAWAREIVSFCLENHFTTEVKQLLQPTGTQFQALFKFLVNQFDPSINFGQGGTGKKFEDEVLATLRMVQYPFTDSISKSHLQAIGSAQSWPNMLAMLHWLVVTIKNRHLAFTSYPELHIPAFDYPERAQSEDVTAHAWLQYVGQSYTKFLFGAEDDAFEEEEEDFRRTVEGSRQAQRQRLDELRAEREDLERQWKELTALPDPIHAYHAHIAAVKSDMNKCNEYISGLTKKMENYKMAKQQAEQDNERARQERESKRAEQHRLEAAVKAQKLTPLEIQTLSSDKQALTKQTHDIQQRYRAVVGKTMSLEVDLNNKITAASALAAEYDEKAQRLGLLDGPIEGYEHVPFAQEVNGASENPVPEGLTAVVKPALQQLRARTRDELKEVNREDVDVEEKVTKVREEMGELADQEKGSEEELRLVDAEKEKLQDVMDREAATTDAELARLQNQVTAISSTMEQALSAAEHRYEQRVVERMAAHEQTSALRNANRAALEQAIEQIMTYKEHMTEKTDRLGALLAEAEGAMAV